MKQALFAWVGRLSLVALMWGPMGIASIRGQELADLKVDSTPRKYSQKNPPQAAKQEFSLTKAGMLKLLYKGSMVYKDSRGGFTLEEVNLSSYMIGPGIFVKRTPDAGATPGQPYTFEQHWLCANRDKPLNLRATVVAPHYPQTEDQLGCNQTLTITFIPFEKISAEPGPAPAVDIAGKWVHGDQNATLTFTATGTAGEYDVTEKGYDNIKGKAKVKGRKVYIDWTTTTAKDGKQKKGVTVVEIKPDGTHAEGWSVGDAGTGGERWSALSGTTAKPVPVKPTGPTTTPPTGPTTTPPKTTSGSGKWDYRVLDLPAEQVFGEQFITKLAELGNDGWELIGLLPNPNAGSPATIRLVFKKPKS